ncbi:MAG: hypothetical protein ACTHJR_15885 [Sphingomonas sp.]|uniref:hypothetical protein n=1 Tax=Sphingomonas sp. TaxID=28214 RepID=UPI003F7D88FF
MEIEVSAETISQIWQQLNSPHQAGRSDGRRTAHKQIVQDGWAINIDIQDVVWETDDRADQLFRHHDAFECLLEPFKLRFESRLKGPFANSDTLYGHNAMRIAEVAAYIMEIERLGFSVDPTPIVEAIRPALLKEKYLTNHEVSVVRYQKERHRCEGIILRSKLGNPTDVETVTTHSGYKATAVLNEEGKATVLRVTAPKSRKDFPLKYWVDFELRRKQQAHLQPE